MRKSSNLSVIITESRRRWDCGIVRFGEWTFEGEPKVCQVGFDGRQPLSAQCIAALVCGKVHEGIISRIGWHRDLFAPSFYARGFLFPRARVAVTEKPQKYAKCIQLFAKSKKKERRGKEK